MVVVPGKSVTFFAKMSRLEKVSVQSSRYSCGEKFCFSVSILVPVRLAPFDAMEGVFEGCLQTATKFDFVRY